VIDGYLLDSHVLLWLDANQPIQEGAAYAIAEALAQGTLFVSDISIWELGVASHKRNLERRPNLRGLSVNAWFTETTERIGAVSLGISRAMAAEAAEVPAVYGSGDPGDCFLIATARVRHLALVTRDAKMISLAEKNEGYLSVVVC
jgi:PIN domain nuclease of toxin-antitoxin system